MPGRVCFIVGARPNFMKAAPMIRSLHEQGLDTLLVHTGQHYDAEMSDVFLRELKLPKPDVFLGVGSGTHGEQTARALVGVEGVLLTHDSDLVVVPGDVNSTLAAALAAVKLHVPVAHLEAGLRSFDPTMPEEHNRKLTDHLSNILLAHSPGAIVNLAHEGITHGVHLVGNTMIDSVLEHLDKARERKPWLALGLEPNEYGLVTLHRPALVDNDELLRATVTALTALARELPIVFPVHPRTRGRLTGLGAEEVDGLVLTAPLGYLDFLGLESAARFAVTDSGGVQEETSALGVQCFTLRDSTERPITVEQGTNTLLGLRPERLVEVPALLVTGAPPAPIPLWDGHAGERAAEVVVSFLSGMESAALDS